MDQEEIEFPSERNQTEAAVKYVLARGAAIRPDELQMLIMLQDEPRVFLDRLKKEGWTPPEKK